MFVIYHLNFLRIPQNAFFVKTLSHLLMKYVLDTLKSKHDGEENSR